MSSRLLVGTRKGVFSITRDSHGKWSVAGVSFLGVPCSLTLHDPRDGASYAALGHGHFGVKLHRSRDQGKTWQEIAAPKYPPKPEGLVELDPNFKKEIPWSTELVWELATGGKDQPGTLWCGTIPGGLFRSDDHGDSWQIMTSLWRHPDRPKWAGGGAELPGIHSVAVDPRDSKRVAVAVSCGGIWQTKDSGETWQIRAKGMRAEFMPKGMEYTELAQDPHRMVRCAAAPDTLWVQHHNGIFVTDDDCANWREITGVKPSVFGFGVVVHPRDPKTAWFVPAQKDEVRVPVEARVVVTRTRDGGKSFDMLTKGLPQHNAYDLVYRHALDLDASGDRLAFGSTTGSLWISENQGDSWQRLDASLPPIYCVRFA